MIPNVILGGTRPPWFLCLLAPRAPLLSDHKHFRGSLRCLGFYLDACFDRRENTALPVLYFSSEILAILRADSVFFSNISRRTRHLRKMQFY